MQGIAACSGSGWQFPRWGRGTAGTRPVSNGDGGHFHPVGEPGRGPELEPGRGGGRFGPVGTCGDPKKIKHVDNSPCNTVTGSPTGPNEQTLP
jgi:hypothetical protein